MQGWYRADEDIGNEGEGYWAKKKAEPQAKNRCFPWKEWEAATFYLSMRLITLPPAWFSEGSMIIYFILI